jgi:hypothetical protein
VALEKGERLAQPGCGTGNDSVKFELMCDASYHLACRVVVDGAAEVCGRQAHQPQRFFAPEIQDFGHVHVARDESSGSHHLACHAVLDEWIDEVSVSLNKH